MGVSRHGRALAGELASRVYVFQSFVVSRPIRFCRSLVPVLLGSHEIATLGGAVGCTGSVGWIDGKYLLSECHLADISRPGNHPNDEYTEGRVRCIAGVLAEASAMLCPVRYVVCRFLTSYIRDAPDHLRKPV